LEKKTKETIIKKFARFEKDTGSCEVQIAILTERIKQISEHLKSFPQDVHSRRGLLRLVGRRRSLSKYFKRTKPSRYEELMSSLEAK